jgi:hypothetical protein
VCMMPMRSRHGWEGPMNKRRWLDEWWPGRLLGLVRQVRVPRRRRLYACACCRRIWDLITDPRSRRAVEIAESFADGQASETELTAAHSEACVAAAEMGAAVVRHPVSKRKMPRKLSVAAQAAAHASAAQVTVHGSLAAAEASLVHHAEVSGEYGNQANLVRDIFGNPSHPVAVEPAWLAWNDATVPAIARHIYDNRAFHVLPILADALEDAGCTNADLLDHCRSPGPHVRGCWAVDLLLGKS